MKIIDLIEGHYYICDNANHRLVKKGELVRYIGPYLGPYDALEFAAPNGHIVHLQIDDIGDEVVAHETRH